MTEALALLAEALALLTRVATIVCAAALVGLHALPTGYRPLHDPVSDYGVGRERTPADRIHIRLAGVAFLAVAVAAPAFHDAVRHTGTGPTSRISSTRSAGRSPARACSRRSRSAPLSGPGSA